MFDIGFLELLVIGVLGLLVLGPERLPVAARTVGLFLGRLKRSVSHFQDDLDRHVRTEELKRKLLDPEATFMDDDVRNPAGLNADSGNDSSENRSIAGDGSTQVSGGAASESTPPNDSKPN